MNLQSLSPLALERLRSWKDPEKGILRFVADNFHVTPDLWQEEVLTAFASPAAKDQRISLQACVGPGKTAVESWCGWWFLSTKGDRVDHPKGMATAVTGDNLTGNLWAEFAKWRGVSPFLKFAFEWTASKIFAREHPETWWIAARSWPKTANPDQQGVTFSGLHSKYVLVLVDESSAIPTPVLRAGEQALSACIFGKLLQAGNPTSLEGMLHAAATQLRHQWRIIRITGDPDDPKAWVHSPRLVALHKPDLGEECNCPRCWAQRQIDTYGRDNPWVKAHILGQFPPASLNALLGIEDVEAAMGRKYNPDVYQDTQKRLGVDVARFGDDRSVIFPRQGLMSWKPVVMRNADTAEIAARVAMATGNFAPDGDLLTFVDDTGHWGHGVIDQLRLARIPVIGVNYAGKALDNRYKNRRAEFWIAMAKWVKAGGRIPNIPEMVAELTTPTYMFSNGQFQLEPKEDVKKRLGRSPDLADALAQTFSMPDVPRGATATVTSRRGSSKATTAFDPYAIDQNQRPAGGSMGRAVTDFDPFER